MVAITSEVEIASSVPAIKLFKAYCDYSKLGPKLIPETYKAIEVIQGDGGAGTINKVTYADGIPFKTSMNKVDTVDVTNLCLGYTIFEGDVLVGVLESIVIHIQFTPSSIDGAGSVFKHKAVYTLKGDAHITEEQLTPAKEAYIKSFKATEAYVNANPDAY